MTSQHPCSYPDIQNADATTTAAGLVQFSAWLELGAQIQGPEEARFHRGHDRWKAELPSCCSCQAPTRSCSRKKEHISNNKNSLWSKALHALNLNESPWNFSRKVAIIKSSTLPTALHLASVSDEAGFEELISLTAVQPGPSGRYAPRSLAWICHQHVSGALTRCRSVQFHWISLSPSLPFCENGEQQYLSLRENRNGLRDENVPL